MPRLNPTQTPRSVDAHLARIAWQWLALGLLLYAAFPAARGYNVAIGWLWYWLIAAPLVALCAMYRQRLWSALRQAWCRSTAARTTVRKPVVAQARRVALATRKRVWLRAA
ncbi:MAG: hypothetical protein Q8L45_14260 [Xanthomonadaceae bacterium]|nr:hypothetical protein [Xanthomonadaceae bacterium]MDP2186740.1 hypothetical protein [Xanthomonadales bacterium]MDZ4117272.1 hypothetical protein [Xanthomonadaceae bacterium]MDZ4376709.1 hypothetical protein [Xanthomonadaceae bacterium]